MTAQNLAEKVGLSNAEGTGLLDGVVFTRDHFDTASGKLNDAGDKVVDAWVATKAGVSEKAGDAGEQASETTSQLRDSFKNHAESLYSSRQGDEPQTKGTFEAAGEKVTAYVNWVADQAGVGADP